MPKDKTLKQVVSRLDDALYYLRKEDGCETQEAIALLMRLTGELMLRKYSELDFSTCIRQIKNKPLLQDPSLYSSFPIGRIVKGKQ